MVVYFWDTQVIEMKFKDYETNSRKIYHPKMLVNYAEFFMDIHTRIGCYLTSVVVGG